jgi:hypothetical protein
MDQALEPPRRKEPKRRTEIERRNPGKADQ